MIYPSLLTFVEPLIIGFRMGAGDVQRIARKHQSPIQRLGRLQQTSSTAGQYMLHNLQTLFMHFMHKTFNSYDAAVLIQFPDPIRRLFPFQLTISL